MTEDEERTYQYDPSGNLVRWEEKQRGTHRAIRWNEENRISEVSDNGRTTAFRYNADGERVLKRGQFGETAFVTQFYTIRNAEVATKHIFAGETRVASQLVRLKPGPERPVARSQGGRERSTTVVGDTGGAVRLAAGPAAIAPATPSTPAAGTPPPAIHGPAHPTGLDRAAEVGQGKKLGVQKQLDGGQPGQGATPSASPGAAPGSLATPSSPPSTPPGLAKSDHEPGPPPWAGPHETRGIDRALEVGQGKKLGILKHLDGDTPPPPPGPPPVTPPPDRGHRSPAIEGPPPHEFQLFFYHGDHLGSSNVITDAFAGVFEHVEYFPFGEPWVDDGGTATLLPYKFTGKELDPETGLYYYGARYYEPRLQRWLSPDPTLTKYLPSLSDDARGNRLLNGGVYNPINISLYTYSAHNPVRFLDPDGFWYTAVHGKLTFDTLTSPEFGFSEKAARDIAFANMMEDAGTSAAISVTGAGKDTAFSFKWWIAIFSSQFWKNFFDDPAHATGGQVAEAEARIATLKNEAVLAALSGTSEGIAKARVLLGAASHTTQDIPAHGGISFGKHAFLSFVQFITFGLAKVSPDDPAANQAGFEQTKERTGTLITSFEAGVRSEAQRRGLSPEEAERIIQRFKRED